MFKNGKSLIQNIKRKFSARIPHQSRFARQLLVEERLPPASDLSKFAALCNTPGGSHLVRRQLEPQTIICGRRLVQGMMHGVKEMNGNLQNYLGNFVNIC